MVREDWYLENQSTKATELHARANIALEALEYPENYEIAETLLREAVELGALQPLHQDYFDHAGALATCLQERHKLDEAFEVVKLALDRVDRTSRLHTAMAADLTHQMAKLEIEAGQMSKAELHLVEAIENKVVTDNLSAMSKDMMVREFENLQALMGRPSDKLARLVHRLTDHRRDPLADPRAYHSTLEQIAAIYIQEREYDAALETFDEGRALLQMDWDTTRIRDQWDAMTATVQNRINNS